MSSKIRKTIVASLAAVTLAGSLAATSSAQAKPWPMMGGWGPAAVIGGAFLGAAIIANQQYNGCGRVRQTIYNYDGYPVGYRWVPAC